MGNFNFKKILMIVIATLLGILIIQNFETTPFSLFFWTFQAPRAVLLVICMVLGFALGYILAKFRKGKEPEQFD
ncbi:MAG: lipopolysaccharide assembly protein LapA domain-containing protein [Oligoflexales bacterium]